MVKVVKFGGSSLASAEQFAKVGDILESVIPRIPRLRICYMHATRKQRQARSSVYRL